MKRLLATSATIMLAASLVFLAVQGAPGGISATGKAPGATVVAQARANFIKVKSAHAPAVGRSGWVSPGGMQRSAPSAASGAVTTSPSINWSGYADSESGTNTVSQVSGNWTIPAVQCPPAPYENQDAFLANWVGIDGLTTQTVEQLGTAAQCFEGVTYYYVWYELYPSTTVEEGTTACINNNVDCPQPGDRISASVTVTSAGSGENNYALTLTDHTRPEESFSTTAQCAVTTCLDASAEWIVERPAVIPPPPAPSTLIQILPLADFGKTIFRSGEVVSGGIPSSIRGFQDGPVYDIMMTDDSGSYYLDCAQQPSPPGTLLPVSQANACPAAAPHHGGTFEVSWDSSF
jgi:Peptidase A4 family